jgi:excisionase family DNA binding protein
VGQQNDYVSSKEAARLLGVHHKSISRMAREGLIRGIKPARDWLIERASIEEYIAAREGQKKRGPKPKTTE